MLDNSKDNGLFDGLMSLIEEVFNSTKQSYYEYFEDFKRIANLLVNNKTLSRFYNIICQLSEPSFRNASKYLEAVMVRVNGEREESSSYNK